MDEPDDRTLTSLQREIEALDRQGGSDALSEALDRVSDQAELAGNLSEPALFYWREVIERAQDPRLADREDALALRIYAQNSAVIILTELGRTPEAHALAAELVREHLDDVPDDAAGAMANAAIWVAVEDQQNGRETAAVALADRIIERLGQPHLPEARRTRVVANLTAGRALQTLGRPARAIERFERVVDDLPAPDDYELRALLADALHRKGVCAYDLGDAERTAALFRVITRRFRPDEGPEIAHVIELAAAWLDAQGPRELRADR